MDKREQLKKEVEKLTKDFRKNVDAINTSDNPYYKDAEVREYEINKLKGELDTKVGEINKEFHAHIDADIEQAEREAARSSFRVMPSDRDLAKQFVTDLKAELTFAMTDSDKRQAIERFEEKMGHFETEGGLYAVKQQLPDVAQAVQDDEFAMKKLRQVNNTFNALQTPEQERLTELQDAKVSGVTHKYRTLQMTHPAFSYKPKSY
ncbi:hypothetical protein [Halobacillus sp. Marseille-Q1614]|uniref:hypothetical protein n=1 Tax=Halobacillus sp. Marseille-Q1614 TaxID=2709134 RepID=UPI00156EE4C9|nr:hypothetical protein [Halobacillus sp. Marseille-Q1614]